MRQEKKKKTGKKEKSQALKLEPATNSEPRPKVDKTGLANASKEIKSMLKDLGKIPKIQDADLEKMLIAIAYGVMPDRFGMEASLDTRLKALDQYQKLQQQKQQNAEGENGNEEVVIIDDIG